MVAMSVRSLRALPMRNAVRTLNVPSVMEPATLTTPAHTQMTAAPQTLTVIIMTGYAMCLYLTPQITVRIVTISIVLEVRVCREKKPPNNLTLGCANLGDDSSNCPGTHPNCNSHVCEEPDDECQTDPDCNVDVDGICEPDVAVADQTHCMYCDTEGVNNVCKPGINKTFY